jgi:hydroxyacylglutathione hydrolase
MATPGHTSDHIVYFGHGLLFSGDTLFSVGCGRLFEGTAEQLHQSLQKICGLPDDTRVYCGHEYTLSNLAFAKTVEPDNVDIQEYIKRAENLQSEGIPTLPSTIGLEKEVNPFLRVNEPTLQQSVQLQTKDTLTSENDVFASLRRWKDSFRG